MKQWIEIILGWIFAIQLWVCVPNDLLGGCLAIIGLLVMCLAYVLYKDENWR